MLMPVEEVIAALQGFSGAYGKVASSLLPQSAHQLRVAAVAPGSFDLSILAWITSAQGKETLAALSVAAGGAKYVFRIVKEYIDTKKHLKGQPFQYGIEGSNNTMIVINADKGQMEISPVIAELLKSKLIDKDLSKVASPLEEGSIDGAEITAMDETETISVNIASGDKAYFGVEANNETSQDTFLTGRLISSNKETLRGTFDRGQGARIPYHYIGDNSEAFQATFAYAGSVRVSCTAWFDEHLELRRIEIKDATRLQTELNFP